MGDVCGESKDHDAGVVAEDTQTDSWSRCESDPCCCECLSSDIEWVHSVSAEDDSWNYDGIHNYKYWYLHAYLTDLPEILYDKSCSDFGHDYVSPGRIDYEVRHPPDWNEGDFKLSDPDPDGSTDDGDGIADDIVKIAMATVSSLSGSALVAAGAAAVSSFVDTNSNDPVDLLQTYVNDTRRQRWQWNIKLSGTTTSDLPDAPCNDAAARMQLENDMPAGYIGKLNTWSRWNLKIPTFYDCVCDDTPSFIGYTSDWSYAQGEFESKE